MLRRLRVAPFCLLLVACAAGASPGPTRLVVPPSLVILTPPSLVGGTTYDPATPYPWSQSLAKQLSSGVLLTRVGDGHTAYGKGSACTDNAVDRFLLTGTPPAEGTVCR